MKVVFGVRSDVAFQLLVKLIKREPQLKDFEYQQRNAQSIRDLEDAIEFYKPDFCVIDKQLPDSDQLIHWLIDNDVQFYTIETNVKDVIPEIIKDHGEEIVEEEIHYEVQERERVVYQEKIIEKEVIKTAYQAIPSKVVVVGSLYSGAGSTTLATNLARMIAARGIDVSYVEHPLIQPYMYDFLQVYTKAEQMEREYRDISREIHRESIARTKGDVWEDKGVKWHVIDSTKPPLESFSYENKLVLSHAIQSNVIIMDISNRWLDPEIQNFLSLADSIVMCVEPDPIKYDRSLLQLEGQPTREKLIMDHLTSLEMDRLDIVMMKYVKGIDVKLIKQMLHKKPIANLPYIPYQTILQSLFKSKLLYDVEDVGDVFESQLIPLIAKIIPKDFIELKKKEKWGFQKFLKK